MKKWKVKEELLSSETEDWKEDLQPLVLELCY